MPKFPLRARAFFWKFDTNEGETVEVGTVVGVIGEEGEAAAGSQKPEAGKSAG